jgi:hypothetical protein
MLKEPTNELPFDYNSGELLAGVLPILDLQWTWCGCGWSVWWCVCVYVMIFSPPLILCLSFSYIPRPMILGHGRGDTAIGWREMVVHGLPWPPRFFSIERPPGGPWHCRWPHPRSGHVGRPLGMWLGMPPAPSRVAVSIRWTTGRYVLSGYVMCDVSEASILWAFDQA